MQIIDGKKISQEIIEKLKSQPRPEKIFAAVLVGDDKISENFLKQKEKVAKELGIDFRIYHFPTELKNDELRKEVLKIALLKKVGGVIAQLPLPEHINKNYILNVIPREKDVDVLGERALGAFYTGRNPVLPPAVGAVEEILTITRNTQMSANIANEKIRKNEIIEKELSYELNGVFFEIHNELGRFCREKQYADALEQKLKEKGTAFNREYTVPVVGKKSNIADFIIENRILVELKRKPTNTGDDYKQVMRYLESANLRLGILVNFGLEYLKPKRILNPKLQHNRINENSLNSHTFVDSSYGSIAIVGAGFLIGKPIAVWLMNQNPEGKQASYGARIKELKIFKKGSNLSDLKNYDLIISGVGKAGLIKPEMLKQGAGVIDFGYSMENELGIMNNELSKKIRGDFDISNIENYIRQPAEKIENFWYTPTPGGTGPILVAKLFENFYKLNKEQ